MKISDTYDREAFNGAYVRDAGSGKYLTIYESVNYIRDYPKQFELFYIRKKS